MEVGAATDVLVVAVVAVELVPREVIENPVVGFRDTLPVVAVVANVEAWVVIEGVIDVVKVVPAVKVDAAVGKLTVGLKPVVVERPKLREGAAEVVEVNVEDVAKFSAPNGVPPTEWRKKGYEMDKNKCTYLCLQR